MKSREKKLLKEIEKLEKDFEGWKMLDYPDIESFIETDAEANYEYKILKAELKGIRSEQNHILKIIDEIKERMHLYDGRKSLLKELKKQINKK